MTEADIKKYTGLALRAMRSGVPDYMALAALETHLVRVLNESVIVAETVECSADLEAAARQLFPPPAVVTVNPRLMPGNYRITISEAPR